MNSSYIVKMLAEISTIMNENKDRLIELDREIENPAISIAVANSHT